MGEEVQANFIFANISPDFINEALGKLKNKDSSGSDKISTNMLKFIIGQYHYSVYSLNYRK